MLTNPIRDEIKLAQKMALTMKIIRGVLVLLIVAGYVTNAKWINEVLIVSVLVLLVFPMSFFDVFIQRLLEYNTQTVEERQVLNAREANETFRKFEERIRELEYSVEDLQNPS